MAKSPSQPKVEEAIEDLKIKSEASDDDTSVSTPLMPHHSPSPGNLNLEEETMSKNKKPAPRPSKFSRTPTSKPQTPKSQNAMHEEIIGGDISVKSEPGKPTKLARSSSQKIIKKGATLFDHLADKTEQATKSFQVIDTCIYQNKHLGLTDDDAFECDCDEDWGNVTRYSTASC
jgi:[histone H3]-lysine36 N-trimethyltransferase